MLNVHNVTVRSCSEALWLQYHSPLVAQYSTGQHSACVHSYHFAYYFLSEYKYFGHSLADMSRVDSSHYIIIPYPHIKILFHTTVQGWRAFLRNTNPITFQIWRHIANKDYKLIGQTFYRPTKTGVSDIPLPAQETFPVQPGDLIGMFFLLEGVIPFNEYTSGCTPEKKTRVSRSPGASSPGRILAMQLIGCRIYALQVLLYGKQISYVDVVTMRVCVSVQALYVVSTLKLSLEQRHDVISTTFQRCSNVRCPLGIVCVCVC